MPIMARYRYVWSAAGLQAKTSDGGLVCANVFGLQRDAFPGLDGFRPLSSLLGCWPWGAASDIRFRKRRFDRCAISVIRQQTSTGNRILYVASGFCDEPRNPIRLVFAENRPGHAQHLVRKGDNRDVLMGTNKQLR